MKNFRSLILIVPILIAGSCIKVMAQNRPENTSSARAAYGMRAEPSKYKTNKKRKARKNKQFRVSSKEKSPANRRRGNWVM